jgi:hypothetical protein
MSEPLFARLVIGVFDVLEIASLPEAAPAEDRNASGASSLVPYPSCRQLGCSIVNSTGAASAVPTFEVELLEPEKAVAAAAIILQAERALPRCLSNSDNPTVARISVYARRHLIHPRKEPSCSFVPSDLGVLHVSVEDLFVAG